MPTHSDTPKNFSPSTETAAPSKELGAMPEWDFSALYNDIDDPIFKSDLKNVEEMAQDFQTKYQGKLTALIEDGKNGAALATCIKNYERISDLLGRIGSFSGLQHYADLQDETITKFFGDTSQKLTEIYNFLLFFSLELNSIDEDVMAKAIKDKELAHFKPWLDNIRLDKPHQLSDELEKLFMEKGMTGRSAWNRLFSDTMSALKFNIQGETHGLEPALNFMVDQNPAARKEAATEISRVLKENERTFTLITNTLAKDKEISDRWRNYDDIADSRHLANRVEREVVDALESAVRSKYKDISHRYYAMKAKWLGMEKLEYWDRNAPLPFGTNTIYSWQEAKDTVLDAYGNFSPKMADITQKFFDNNWIDAPNRPGKAPGAFAHPTVPSAHPFVLLNYLGKPRDVATLAHELGHGVHQYLANEQGPLMASTPLTLAETASVFGEMLTFRSMLAKTTTPQERKAMIAGKVEDMINTVVRQIAFYSFERKIHSARREGELTSEQIGDFWLEIQQESLGDAVKTHEDYRIYWSYIPHFINSPFYVYSYAFGDCLVNSLYAVYEQAEDGFAEKYFDMLRAGGSKHHTELLKPFGLDASDPTFWLKGLSMIEGFIDELESMEV